MYIYYMYTYIYMYIYIYKVVYIYIYNNISIYLNFKDVHPCQPIPAPFQGTLTTALHVVSVANTRQSLKRRSNCSAGCQAPTFSNADRAALSEKM